MSTRLARLRNAAEVARREQYLASIRLSNANRGLAAFLASPLPKLPAEEEAMRTEVRHAHAKVLHAEQTIRDLLHAEQLHVPTTDEPNVLLLVIDPDGGRRVIERRSLDGTPTWSPEADDGYRGLWFDISDPDDARGMSFDEAIRVDEGNPTGSEFLRLYDQTEAEDLADRAIVIHRERGAW